MSLQSQTMADIGYKADFTIVPVHCWKQMNQKVQKKSLGKL